MYEIDTTARRIAEWKVDDTRESSARNLGTCAEPPQLYFDELEAAIPVKEDNWISSSDARNRDLYWGQLTDEQRGNARQLAQRMLDLAGQLAEAARNSPLASEADVRDVMIGAKTLRGALLLRKFYDTPIEVLHD